MSSELNIYEDKFKKVVTALETEYNTIRAGRANPKILDKLVVEYYGTPTPVMQLANVSVPEARIIEIKPWDASALKEIDKAISASDIGINPTNDGKTIRLVFPDLTEERRKDLTKDIKKKCEDAKVVARNIRRDALEDFKAKQKKSEITEDDLKRIEKQVQDMTDKYVDMLDKCSEDKTKDVMSV